VRRVRYRTRDSVLQTPSSALFRAAGDLSRGANAPIFKVAYYGTTCDLFDLLPALTERLNAKAG
jgi:hypothetical protein